MKARVLVLDVLEKKFYYEAEVEELDDFYKHLKCDCFDIATRRVGDKYFDMFVDDVGLFAENPVPSVFNADTKEPMLVGNVIFANHDAEGNTTSLTDADICLIKEHLVITADKYTSESNIGLMARF